ncbi:FadR/GntR family transcriptional regulator [Pseudophaeobacter sp.]|uniref:FadR/GntR family transcriptional regulator n=1 Tax=Pseudophaeobacter sp. TaxID=1971739 RepID=UPI003299B9A2
MATAVKPAPGAAKTGRDRTLSDRVYEKILALIASGETPVGAKLPTEHVLSEQLEVSRPVLRQALKQLREDGVIVSRQGSGSFVQRRPDEAVLDFAPVGSIADIQRTFEFRAAIEGEAAFLAAQRRTDADLARMQAQLEELDRCISEGELGVETDEAFHEAICTASGNQYFTVARTSMKTNILTGLKLTRNLSLTKPQERLELVQREHYQIFDAIKAGDAEAARTAMRLHVESARKRVFEG